MRFTPILFVALVLGTVSAVRTPVTQTFAEFVAEFNKPYVPGTLEYFVREGLFNVHVHQVNYHNLQTNATWELGINQFSDMTVDEFKASVRGFNKAVAHYRNVNSVVPVIKKPVDVSQLPEEVDWRTKGVVTPVKNQGGCGSCWAFSTIETVESHLAIATGTLTELSEQQLVSCLTNPDQCGGTGGCSGATMDLGFEYIKKNGITDEWHYPYVSISGSNDSCKANVLPFAGVTGYVKLESNAYEPLLEAVATQGPVSITVDASSWGSYRGGVFDGCNQVNPDLDHGVQLVGYGKDATTGALYWLVRNSWGPKWGENGFIRVKRTEGEQVCGTDVKPSDGAGCKGGPATVKVCGTCGILYDSSYPTGAFLH